MEFRRNTRKEPHYLRSIPLPEPLMDPHEISVFMADVKTRMVQGKSRFPKLLSELQGALLEVDPMAVLAQINVLDAIRRNTLSAASAFGSDASMEFLAGLVTAMEPSSVVERIGMEFHPNLLLKIDGLLKEIANCQNDMRFGEQMSIEEKSDANFAKLLLNLESNFDRTEGYQSHVEKIVEIILGPLAAKGIEKYGFPPAICIELAKAQMRKNQEKFDQCRALVGGAITKIPTKNAAQSKELRTAAFVAEIRFGAPELETDLAASLAENCGISLEFVKNALSYLTTELGSQEKVDRFDQPLSIQNRPIIETPDGRMIWIRPIDFAHEALNWFHDLCVNDEEMKVAFDKSRQRETPRMVQNSFAKVFGDSKVYLSPTYESPGRPDTDVLVLVPDGAILVEVKAPHFTQKGRRGDIGRIKTKHQEMILAPLDQLQRAERNLLEKPESWTDSQGRYLRLKVPKEILKVVVTLENIDSISIWSQLQNRTTRSPERFAWPVSLSDLMAVVEILDTPGELYSYILGRTQIFGTGFPMVGMETDSLALWCRDRFPDSEAPAGVNWFLNYQSDEMNDYFTLTSAGFEITRPNSSIPKVISDSLTDLYISEDPNWLFCVSQVTSITPREWKPFQMALEAEFSGKIGSKRAQRLSRKLTSGISIAGKITVTLASENSSQHKTTMTPIYLRIEGDQAGSVRNYLWEWL